MNLPDININQRQRGIFRIEIAAIVMLFTAFVLVLSAQIPSTHQLGVAQAGEQVQILPAMNVGKATTLLLPAVGQESNTL